MVDIESSTSPVLCAAEQLRDALYVAMSDCGSKPCKIFLSPTPATPIDVCCSDDDCDGQAWVSVIGVRPTYNSADIHVQDEVRFELGIARCAHTLDDHGEAPSAEDLNSDTEKLARDFGAMRRAMLKLFVVEAGVERGDYRLGEYDVHPVGGGCMASTHEFFLNLRCTNTCC